MDKFEYKVRAEEIKSLIAQGDYAQAAEIADSIDWRRVKSVMMLCTVSDLYKINRRYEDARNMLLLAYDRHPGGRAICYSLCELSIKMEEIVDAVEYYKEFVQVAPKDSGRYVLQYKLYEAQDVSLEERIAVLEELKKKDYREKWAYELAYLYHRVGLSSRCVEECDELILWFGEGKYVIKAMELKMLHQPLTPEQQQKYDYRFQPRYEQTQAKEEDIQVKTVDVSQFNTINLQEELAEGLKEVLGEGGEEAEQPYLRERNFLEEALSMEPDGQISLVVPEEPVEEEQVIGQMSIEDVMKEWERLKREAELGRDISNEAEIYAEEAEQTEAEEYVVEEQVEEEEAETEEFAGEEELMEEEEAEQVEEVSEEPAAEEVSEEPAEEVSEEPAEEISEESAEEEPAAEVIAEEAAEEEESVEEESAEEMKEEFPATEEETAKPHVRNMTKEEKELFGAYVHNRSARQKLVEALDKISLASYTGNVIVTGDEGIDTLNLAKNIIRDVQATDSNFSGKTAKISGQALNVKNVLTILDQLKNGALIIQKASDMNEKTAASLYKGLQRESHGIVVVMEDSRKNMNKFLEKNSQLNECFNARMDMEALSNDALVEFGKKYAREQEYSIDEMGILALHTRIDEMQSVDHAVTVTEVKEIVDEAIRHANKKNIKHFFDILLAKRYDEEDMVILKENDFI